MDVKKQCPLCKCKHVDNWQPDPFRWSDSIMECLYCLSLWRILDDGKDYEVLADNTDQMYFTGDPRFTYRPARHG